MRELIYLSEHKLQQFMTDKSSSWRTKVRMEGDIKFPGIGGVKVGPADAIQGKRTDSDLGKVIAEIESSSRAAGWFADRESRPGQWVYFEAPLSFTAIGHLVIFLDLGKPTDSYPTGGSVRLVLHGSVIHLVGSTSVGEIPPTAFGLSRFYRMMRELDPYLAAEEAKLDGSTAPAGENKSPSSIISKVIDMIDQSIYPEHTAAWMAGYARITAKLPTTSDADVVVATPLYVEYTAEPGL
jgi:hypothetical protein